MEKQKFLVKDPLSGYPFLIESPFPLDAYPKYAFHPAYFISFDKFYKEAKSILLNHEGSFSLQEKTLTFSILLYKLSEEGIIQFKQFKTLRLSYNFFADQELLAKFFFLLPKILFASDRLKRQLPKFRIQSSENIQAIHFWLKRIEEIFNKRDNYYKANQYDENYLKISAIFQRWKTYSTNHNKLPQKVVHYIQTVTAFTPKQKEDWDIYFRLSAGELYLKNRAKSKEAFELFWELLYLTDHIEIADYQNTLTFEVVKWLKRKINQWVEWEPSFFDISLDYRLLEKKERAWENAKASWVIEQQAHAEKKEERKELAKSALQRIKEIRERQIGKEESTHKKELGFSISVSPIKPKESSNLPDRAEGSGFDFNL